ncbi:MAG: cytochrome c oxidase accessory protein CcoG [Verrucomicrobiaceae bacterium]|nr:cytochrome c oxidase accessory protein CcoG [Verrucomicrobiaceae bacterium]
MPPIKQPNLDTLTSVNADGSHHILHPSDVRGPYTFWRRLFGLALISVYVLLPWIPVGGFPAVFLNLAERRFHFFGLTFLSEDLWIGFFLLTGLGFSLFYVTALFGRLWCGWACPYTVFLEHIYRRIERFIDGDATNRRRLDAAPWTAGKIARRVLKQGLYLLASLLIAHVFVSYFVSLPRLYGYMRESPLNHLKVFGTMLFLTASLHFCFAWFREQFCIILCPYGRIQSALTDDDTVNVGYDTVRGEPRGKRSDTSAGDCVDCYRCVQVCPTGIDIRDGIQLECIGCAACIDACDTVMTKLDLPKGLIRYDSPKGLAGGKHRYLRSRTVLYTCFMAVGALVLGISLLSLSPAKAELIRMTGNAYYLDESGVRNQYRLHLVTKRNEPTEFRITLEGLPEGAAVTGLDEVIVLQAGEETVKTLLVQVPKAAYRGEFSIRLNGLVTPGNTKLTDTIEFLGPSAYALE